MPKKQIKNSFNAGEISEYLTGRTDLAKYFTGCSKLINGTVLTYGGVEKRPGTIFRAQAKGISRVRSFEFSVDDTHVLEFGVNYMRVFKDGVQAVITKASVAHWVTSTLYSVNDIRQDDPADTYYYCAEAHTSGTFATDLAAGKWVLMTDAVDTDNLIYELHTPYDTIEEIFAFHSTQSADVMYIGCSNVHPQKISRLGDTDWTIVEFSHVGGPFLDQNTDDELILTFRHYDGTHDGGTVANVMTDSTETFIADTLIDFTLYNTTDDTSGTIIGNTTTTITTDAGITWDFGDLYEVGQTVGLYHAPDAVGTLVATGFASGEEPFTDPTHIGSGWELQANRVIDESAEISGQVDGGTLSSAIEIQGDFFVDTSGFPVATSATVSLERKEPLCDWQTTRTFTSATIYSASEDEEGILYRLRYTGTTAPSNFTAVLTAKRAVSRGVVEIIDIVSSTSAIAKVTKKTFTQPEESNLIFSELTNSGGTHVIVTVLDSSVVSVGDLSVFKGISTARFSFMNLGSEDNVYTVTAIGDATHFTIDAAGASAPPDTTGIGEFFVLGENLATRLWSEDAWSDFRGFPRTVTFHEDRLWWGGTTNNPQTVWGSKTSDYENYEAGVFADDAVIFALNANDVSQIQWLESRDRLIIGTADAEFVLGAANPDNAITPEDVKVRNQSAYGSSGIQPAILNDALFYVQRAKRRLRAMIFDLQSASLRSFDANRLHNTILESSPVEIAAQKTTEGAIYLVKEDGSLAVFVYEPLEEVAGWSRAVTGALSQSGFFPVDGKFKSVCVTPGDNEDTVTFSIERTIDGSTVYYIEEFAERTTTSLDESVLVDSALQVASGEDPQQIVCASDTVRCNFGNCNSGPCGGVLS